MQAEGSRIDREPRGRGARFKEIALFALALMAAAPGEAEARDRDTRSPDNPWAQLMGENTEEREREADKIERECATLEARIASLEKRLDEDGMRYARDPGLKFKEQGDLADVRRELAQKQAAVKHLRESAEQGAARAAERRGKWSDSVEGTAFEFTDPTLDLSARKIGNDDIAAYYAKYKVGWKDHSLYFDMQDETPDGARLALKVGPEFTDADFYFQDAGKDLMIVLTTTSGGHKTLKLDDGYFGGFYDSDARGKAVPVEIEE